MKEVFVDTAYWLAIISPRDPYHAQAVQYPRSAQMVTTWAVLIEVLDALSDPALRGAGVAFWQASLVDPSLHIVPLNKQLLQQAVELYANRPDKAWSLTDCISFTVMKDRGIVEVLTTDHHFEQAGFRALLRG